MPITSKVFDSSPDFVNPELLDLFKKNPSKAYSYNELSKKFSNQESVLIFDIVSLTLQSKIECRSINGEAYYRLKKKV